MPHQKFLDLSEECKTFTEKSMDFQRKIIERSGLGDETYLPDGAPKATTHPSNACAH